ncbi:MAG: hypothetical protein CMP48_07670 [Rickettsiales bacterium]|nr:hypothetical protein [Rickettsiales bacterium]
MRVLVCLSSLPRHFDVFVQSFQEKVLSQIPYTIDLVAHFPTEPDGEALKSIISLVDKHLVKVEADPTFTWELDYQVNLIGNQGIKGNLLQWHSMASCGRLKKQMEEKNGQPYDWVIWSRPDLFFFNELKFDFSKASYGLFVPPIDGHGGLNDRFCIGSSEVIDERLDILKYFLKVWYPSYHNDRKYLKRKGKIWARYSCWNPEMVFKQLLLDKGVSYHFLDFILGKIRRRAFDSGESQMCVSVPFFDVRRKSNSLNTMKKRLKSLSVQEYEDERTKLIDLAELQELLNDA